MCVGSQYLFRYPSFPGSSHHKGEEEPGIILASFPGLHQFLFFGLKRGRLKWEHLPHDVSGGSKGGGTQGTFPPPPPLELSNALLLGRGLAVATYISLTSHLLPPESRLLASYTRTDRSCANNIMWPHPPLFYIVKMCPPLLKILNPPLDVGTR